VIPGLLAMASNKSSICYLGLISGFKRASSGSARGSTTYVKVDQQSETRQSEVVIEYRKEKETRTPCHTFGTFPGCRPFAFDSDRTEGSPYKPR
jgi:hypothetical protein